MLHERVQSATDKGLLIVADLSDSDEGVWGRDYVRVLWQRQNGLDLMITNVPLVLKMGTGL